MPCFKYFDNPFVVDIMQKDNEEVFVTLNDTLSEQSKNLRICENEIFAFPGYCLHNQLKFYSLIMLFL